MKFPTIFSCDNSNILILFLWPYFQQELIFVFISMHTQKLAGHVRTQALLPFQLQVIMEMAINY